MPELIAFISNAITLEPGDVIATGTPAGVGVFRDPPVFLEPGDRVRCEIEGIGSVENPVIDWSDVADTDAPPDARRRGTLRPMQALVKTHGRPRSRARSTSPSRR